MNVRVRPHKHNNHKWAVDYRCPVTKKRKYEACGTKAEAITRKKELEGQQATGKYVPVHKRPWGDFIVEYKEKMLSGKKFSTQLVELRAIKAFEKHCRPGLLQDVNTKMIDEFKSKRAGDEGKKGGPLSRNTINIDLTSLRTILRVAHRWEYLAKMPLVKKLKTPDVEPRAISPSLFERILGAAATMDDRLAKHRNHMRRKTASFDPPGSGWWLAFLSVAYLAGLRWQEILNLKWRDLRFTGKPEVRVFNEKAGRHENVPMTRTLYARLKAWMDQSTNVADDALVFPHECHVRTVHSTWRRLQQWARISDRYRFHDLRVSFCTNLVASGTRAATLMKLARHRSIATTMKYYRGLTEDTDREAMEKMEASFAKVETEVETIVSTLS